MTTDDTMRAAVDVPWWDRPRPQSGPDDLIVECRLSPTGEFWQTNGDSFDRWLAEHDAAALSAALPVVLAPLRAMCFQSDDGTKYVHVENCEGEDTCPACWAEDIRSVLDALPGGEQA